jgi:hypothetical protein
LIKVKQAGKKQKEAKLKAVARNARQSTVFERVMDLKASLRQAAGLEPMPYWERSKPEPEWGRNISLRLGNTILKSICKLRPNGEINWRNYGRCIGLLERYKTFQELDLC